MSMKISSFLALFLSLTIVFQAVAAEAPHLKTAIDEFNYELTVEWDQKDHRLYGEIVKRFHDKVRKIDFSKTDKNFALNEVLSSLPESGARNALMEELTLIDANRLSAEEFQSLLRRVSETPGTTGASWNLWDRIQSGEFLIPGFIAFAVLIFVIPLIITSDDKPDRNPNPNPNPGPGTDPGTTPTPTPTPDPAPAPSPSPSPTYRCEFRDTCAYNSWGQGRDEYGFPVGSGTCGYEWVCGYFY